MFSKEVKSLKEFEPCEKIRGDVTFCSDKELDLQLASCNSDANWEDPKFPEISVSGGVNAKNTNLRTLSFLKPASHLYHSEFFIFFGQNTRWPVSFCTYL